MIIEGFDYKEKEVEELTDKITDLIADEFDRTADLGPIHHFMAFCNIYTSLLTFFFGALSDSDNDCDQLLDIIHEMDDRAMAIHKELKGKKRKLN